MLTAIKYELLKARIDQREQVTNRSTILIKIQFYCVWGVASPALGGISSPASAGR
jgi:hypothetical protein